MEIFPKGPQSKTGEYGTFTAVQYTGSPQRHLEAVVEEMKKDIAEHGTPEFSINTLIHVVRKSLPLNTVEELRSENPKSKDLA